MSASFNFFTGRGGAEWRAGSCAKAHGAAKRANAIDSATGRMIAEMMFGVRAAKRFYMKLLNA